LSDQKGADQIDPSILPVLLDQPYVDKRIEIFTDQQKKFTPARNQPSGGEFKLHGIPTRVKRAVGLINFRCTDVSGSH
jgi:hypothetical protein